MRAAVVGATGVLGRHVIPRLLERGHEVSAVVRRSDQAEALRRMGVAAVVGDIMDEASLDAGVVGCDVALHLATAIPAPGSGESWSRNDQIRRIGTHNLLASAERAGVRRYVQQSIVFLHGDRGAQMVDEASPLRPAPHIQSAADMEALVHGAPLEWSILRGGALYGPGTGRETGWRTAARAGTLKLPGDGRAYISLIHAADLGRAVVLAAESAPPRSTYLVIDDEPVMYRTLYAYVAAQAGAPDPSEGAPPLASLRCSNARIKAAFGWTPAYPTFRSGLA